MYMSNDTFKHKKCHFLDSDEVHNCDIDEFFPLDLPSDDQQDLVYINATRFPKPRKIIENNFKSKENGNILKSLNQGLKQLDLNINPEQLDIEDEK